MPAVTVDDILVLPRIPEPDPAAAADRPVVSVTTAPSGFEGEGFPVRRAFAGVDLPGLDPFIHMDQMGEVEYAPGEPKGTAWHPHRGFETVTYIIDGTFHHQDSNGGGGLITNGDTQWMTAGGGILHIEVPPEQLVASGGLFHGFQLWVNLPRALKMTDPRYQDIRAGQVALLVLGRRRRAAPASSPASWRARRPRRHPHADHPGARHRRARRPGPAALAARLQRARLRAGGHGHGGRRAPPGPHRPAGRVRPRRRDHRRRRASSRTAERQEHRRPAPRRPADPRAGRRLRAVRDEHQGRAGHRRSRTTRPAASGSIPAQRTVPEEPHPGHDVL